MKKPEFVRQVEIRLRERRFNILKSLLDPLPRPVRILDVGGEIGFWENIDYKTLGEIDVTLLNTFEQPNLPPRFYSRIADARCLDPYRRGDFDVVISNSVIGHVGALSDQKKMAAEIQRISVRFFVQTPNKYFPIDWRTLVPFFHLLTVKRQAWWLYHLPIAHFGRFDSYTGALAWAGKVRNLTRQEIEGLFPGAKVLREKVFGLTKSFIIIKGF